MERVRSLAVPAIWGAVVLGLLSAGAGAADATFTDPQPVTIDSLPRGHGGTPISTEEPFVSRDGRFLFFNSGEKENHKDLHFAEWRNGRWEYHGEIGPNVNTATNVEGNPSMDAAGNFFYVDSGAETMVRAARFDPGTGKLSALSEVKGVPTRVVKPFRYFEGNMGVEVSPDGETLYVSRATWNMNALWLGMITGADILFSQRRNGEYVFDETRAREVMKNINTPDLEYAESISADGLELFFVRMAAADLKKGTVRSQIMRATRASVTEPFGIPEPITVIGGEDFVEAPSISPDGRELYYHKREGEKFRIYKVTRAR
jgi:hypothetical protein